MLKEAGATHIKITDFGFSKDFLSALSHSLRASLSAREIPQPVGCLLLASHCGANCSWMACDADESLPKTKRLGTLAYMAPEVALDGQGSYDGHMADVWGCGVILYTLAAGQYPFGDESQEQPSLVYQRVVSGQWAEIPRGQVSAECVDLIRKILVPDPTQRATIADIKSHAWFTGTVFPEPPLPGSIGSISSIGSDGLREFQWPSYDEFATGYVLGDDDGGGGASGGAVPDPATLGADVRSDLVDPMTAGFSGGHSSGGSGSGSAGGSFLSSNSSGHEEMMAAPPPRVDSPPAGGWSQGGLGSSGAPQAKWPTWTGGASAVGGGAIGEHRDHAGAQLMAAGPAVARPRIRSDASDGSTGSFGSFGSLRCVMVCCCGACLDTTALTGRNCFVGRTGAMWLAKEAAPRCGKRHCDLNEPHP